MMTRQSDIVATSAAISTFLSAIASRDLRSIRRSFAENITWQNVPHPPVVGPEAVMDLLAGIVCWSDAVRWDVVDQSVEPGVAWVERVDRFWIDGTEHAVRCNGRFVVDPIAGVISEVRDYVDLGEWRKRIRPIYTSMAERPPIEVVRRHLAAVERRDVIAMAADYALDAHLERPNMAYRGWFAIADYFSGVRDRLGSSRVSFAAPVADATCVSVPWLIVSNEGVTRASGVDRSVVTGGRITHQQVTLDADDF